MTAWAAGFRKDYAFVMADTGWTESDGRIAHLQSKLTEIPHLNAVVTYCGRIVIEETHEQLLELASRCADVGAYLRALPDFTRGLFRPTEGMMAVLVIGFYDMMRRQAAAFVIGPAKHQFIEGARFVVTPAETAFHPTAPFARWPGNTFDPNQSATALMNEFRKCKTLHGTPVASGWGELAIISAEGIQSWKVADWNDQLDVKAA